MSEVSANGVRGRHFSGTPTGVQGAQKVTWVLKTEPVVEVRQEGRWIEFKDSALSFFHGAESVETVPGKDRVEITLFDAKNHPFHTQVDCFDEPRAVRPKINRVAKIVGSTLDPVDFWNLPKGGTIPRVSPFPHGFRGAFVFSDHADQSSLERLKVIGDAFLARNLVMTKTIFVRSAPGYYAQGQLAPFAERAKKLQKAGFEIGLHSPSGVRDTRPQVAESLAFFRKAFTGTTWIDHQPDTNCEAISNQGWDLKSPWGILDLVRDANFRWIWSGEDQRLDQKEGLTLALKNPFWVHPDLPGVTVFTSAWAYLEPTILQRRYSREMLEALARQRGIHIAHTYLDTFQANGPHAILSLLIKNPTGGLELHPTLGNWLDELQTLQAKKDLWVTTVEKLGGAWIKTQKLVRMEPARGGQVRFVSPGPIPGFTILTPPHDGGDGELKLDGTALPHTVGPDGQHEYWLDLVREATLELPGGNAW